MKRKTYKRAHADCKRIIAQHPQYKDFEFKYWGGKLFVRDPRGYSFGFIFSKLPCYGFDIMSSKDGTEDHPNGGKFSWGGYRIYLRPDDYKEGRGKHRWIQGEYFWKGAPN